MGLGQALRRLARRPAVPVVLVLLSLPLLLAVLLVVAILISERRTSNEIEAKLADIRAAGEPVSPADLEKHYRIPPGKRDLTRLWLEATTPLESRAFATDSQRLPLVGIADYEIPPPGQPWPDLEAAEKLLEKYKRSLDLLHEAAEQDGAARYPTDFRLGIEMPLEHARLLRQGARLLALEAHVRAHRADPDGVAASIDAIFVLARSLEREPTIMSQLVRQACDGIAREQLHHLLPAVSFREEALICLQEDLRAADYHAGLYEAGGETRKLFFARSLKSLISR